MNMNSSPKPTGKTEAKIRKYKKKSSASRKTKGKSKDKKRPTAPSNVGPFTEPPIREIPTEPKIDSQTIKRNRDVDEAETIGGACEKRRRKCRDIMERNRTVIGLSDTEDEEFSDGDGDPVDKDYNPADDEDEEIELDDDEEWVEEEVNLYSTFATSSKVFSTKSNKIGVGFYYLNFLGAPDESTWKGKGGTINKIMDAFKISGKGYYNWVKLILANVRECMIKNVEYTGQNVKKRRGPMPELNYKSREAEIIAQTMEDGLGIRHASFRVNFWRQGKGKEVLGMTCIHSLFQKLKPKFSVVGKMKTGSNDATSEWAKARLKWCIQLVLIFRAYVNLEDLGLDPDPMKNPDCFNPTKLEHVKLTQVAWWDEHHIECVIAGLGGNNLQIRFPKNEDGTLNPDGGTISKVVRKTLNVKYKKQGRYCLGVAKVSINGEESARRGLPFYYTERKVISIKQWEALYAKEIHRVKTMDRHPYWVEGLNSSDGVINPTSSITKLPQVASGGTTEKTLVEAGFLKVSDLMPMTDVIIKKLSALKGIGKGKIDIWRKKIEEMLNNAVPAETVAPARDHRKHPNPYYSKWGDIEGEKKIRKCTALNKFCCIKELVIHIVDESKAMFKGTDHENNWFFYHDALSMMTSADTIVWMRREGYLKHWILPQHGLLDGTRYENKLPGDSPELMPMDSTLNKDIDDCGKRHVAVTCHLEWNKDYKDQRKFSLATPKEGNDIDDYMFSFL